MLMGSQEKRKMGVSSMYVLVISAVAHLTMIEEAPGWKSALELLVRRVAEFRTQGGSVGVDLKGIRL